MFFPDGKTVTTRKVETVSKSAGVGGMSYGKPAGNDFVNIVTSNIVSFIPLNHLLNEKT